MIVLDRIDPIARRVAWTDVDVALPGATTREGVESSLRRIGLGQFEALADDEAGVDHEWSIENDVLVTRASVPVAHAAPSCCSFYVGAVIGMVTWAQAEDALSLHLALYELMTNVHEHGRPLTDREARVRIEFRIQRDRIVVVLEDDCEAFDPAQREVTSIESKIRNRDRGGYGVTLVERAIDTMTWEYGEGGNRIRIEKELGR